MEVQRRVGSAATPTAWSCYTRTTDELVGGGYGDVLGHRYEYDSNVVNHKAIAPGDLLVVRDGQLILGHGVVEDVTSGPGVKTMRRCPQCGSADATERKRALPRYRCNDCKAEFDEPVLKDMAVTRYSAVYRSSWRTLDSPLPVRALEGVYAGADRQNAIRRLDWARALTMLEEFGGVEEALEAELLRHGAPITGGHVDAVVRRRVGQQRFRERLLDRYGPTCAVTGAQPEMVLDAAHLYRFADRPEHADDGGLLLRADVHRLFDRLVLTFHPRTWTTQVAPVLLERHESLAVLDGRRISVHDTRLPDVGLIEEHHAAARARWKELARV
ncbi:HNH endonuclease [Cellulomonas sp. Sa3CUA2]|uniref:HNH endonuclease n=1 Tax=Cellulomonas avistercoris TaxID=2762242 RepID=A0ABR8QFF1_9CELL|nr:HNH endonuclease signature motif containing protein [Cellulomonas avistercoris]MBD7919157.1 HNH endonuclease [Cellulomonas avistercoris]